MKIKLLETISTPNPIEVAKEYLGYYLVTIEYSIDYNNPFSKVLLYRIIRED